MNALRQNQSRFRLPFRLQGQSLLSPVNPLSLPVSICSILLLAACVVGCATPNRPHTSPVAAHQEVGSDLKTNTLPHTTAERSPIAPVTHLSDRTDTPDTSIACSCCPESSSSCQVPVYGNPFVVDPQEYLCDGGDAGNKARVRSGGKFSGIDSEDTVVQYKTQTGQTQIQASNRVCVYSPRFAAVRKVTKTVASERAVSAGGLNLRQGLIRIDSDQPSSAVTAQRGPKRNIVTLGLDALKHRNQGIPVETVVQPVLADEYLAVLSNLSLIARGVLEETDKVLVDKATAAAIAWSHDTGVAIMTGQVDPVSHHQLARAEGITVYDFPGAKRLQVTKLADKQSAQPGQVVTFIIRIDNIGEAPVEDVILTDNLTTRLEYVADSQTCDRKATFSTKTNQGASLQLTWKLNQPLKRKEGAMIQFECRVR